MTQDHSALLAQLDALKSADASAVFAELIRAGLQQLIEAEATAAIGAGRYQRTEGRAVHRNGHRPKTVSTTSGDIEVQIPKLRVGSFFPSLLERRRRIDKALHAVDPLTGLIVAAALVMPGKKLASVTSEKILNRFKEKAFARGANREQIKTCSDMGISLEEFVSIGLEAMQLRAAEIGL